jgi:GDP-L-fucose synthase
MADASFFGGKRICVAGHRGMVGSAIVRALGTADCELLTLGRDSADLRDQAQVDAWFAANRPDLVFLAAAKVGGIGANNSFPADFLYDNLMIEANIIKAAHDNCVAKLLFLGSSCIYPKFADQPLREDALLTGALEPTNEWYAVAKIAGIKLAEAFRIQHGDDYISGMPTNLYGPGDNFDLVSSHVLPALMRKVMVATATGQDVVEIWGSGKPLREFMHVDDCADACLFLMEHYSGRQHVNIGSGQEISIADLAMLIGELAGYQGRFEFNPDQPDGTPRKLLDTRMLRGLGWQPRISRVDGIRAVMESQRAADWLRDAVDVGARAQSEAARQ